MDGQTPRALHRYAVFLACAIVALIAAGGLVKSLEAGLSVPDWPTSYGGLNPPRWWEIENVRAEHGHRLFAGTVALLTVGLAIWAARREPRLWVRRLAYTAVAAVLFQAILGGVTVLLFLPPAVSVSHAALAQLYLCVIVTIALVTSRSWLERSPVASGAGALRGLVTGTTGLIFLQTLAGALVRHTGSGLAIPDFPLMFGGLWPPEIDFSVAVQLVHRFGALLVTLAIAMIWLRVFRSADRRGLAAPTLWLGIFLLIQVALGATIIWTGRAVLPNTLHVPNGAALLATSLILTLRVRRASTAGDSDEGLGEGSSAAPA